MMMSSRIVAFVMAAVVAESHRDQFERPLASCDEPEFVQMLDAETSMLPTVGQVVVDIPFDILKDFFRQPALWPSWNHFVSNTQTQQFELCEAFHSDFLDFAVPFTRDYQPAGHQTIVKLEDTPDLFQVAWKYHIVDNEGETAIFGKHGTSVYRFNGSADKSAFYTWEKATGYEPRYAPEAFLKTFEAVVERSMEGIACLESVYANTDGLEAGAVEAACGQSQAEAVYYYSYYGEAQAEAVYYDYY